jgi:peptidoglycan hydrolase-like protein with peptidoglycan-binding domain
LASSDAVINRLIKLSPPITLAVMLIVSAIDSTGAAALNTQKSKRTRPPEEKPTKSEIREAEQRLFDLGLWTGPIDGIADQAFRHALIAFEKVAGRARAGRLTREEIEALTAATRAVPLEGGPLHVEIDLDRQVLFIVDGGAVLKILPVSTGNDELFTVSDWTRRAVTPRGRFKVYRKITGWRKSDLGLMYYPSYIVGGIAIHGSNSVPVRPASHGCIRIPMFAAKEFSALIPIGTPVIVYDAASRKAIENSATADARDSGQPVKR